SLQLPLIYILEYALAQLWMSRGVKPAALIGHSVGENTAAAVAGVLGFEDGIDLVLLRGQLFDEVPAGGMISVPLSAAELLPLLGDELDLACINGPELSVASGPMASLTRLHGRLAERDVHAQWIRIQIAAHSRMLDPILGRFGDFLRGIKLSAPRLPIVSNRTGEVLTPEQARSPEYWVEHLRNTVRFGDGIGKLLETPGRVFLEVGPGRALGSLARTHAKVTAGQAFIGSLPHPDDDTPDDEVFLAACGRLWAAGADFDLAHTRGPEKRQRVELPTYAFHHQRYWIEPQVQRAPETSVAYPARIRDPERTFFAPTWRQHFPDLEPDLTPHTWLVFVDETGLGAELAQRLHDNGDQVIRVRTGDTFVKISDDEYRLAAEQGAEGYELLLREVFASGKTPDRIVHTWLLSDGERFRPGSSFFHRNQECGFFSLLFLAQALSSLDVPSRLHVAVVTSGMQQAGGSRVLYPDQATVLGPCKVMPRELPGVTCASIDLARRMPEGDLPALEKLRDVAERLLPGALPVAHDPQAAAERTTQVEALLAELRLPPASGEVVLGPGARWERRYEHIT
ncbi:MAG TPA: acyltransferase domain-containing protein, partial [Polyangiales bacterium]|nr:acyltransferase domain-containing protein [Polyangiales bacterium]